MASSHDLKWHHCLRYVNGSLFCLAPTGSGWGMRLRFALLSGCIPVIIDDHVRVRFEGWHRVSCYQIGLMSEASHDLEWHHCFRCVSGSLFCLPPQGPAGRAPQVCPAQRLHCRHH